MYLVARGAATLMKIVSRCQDIVMYHGRHTILMSSRWTSMTFLAALVCALRACTLARSSSSSRVHASTSSCVLCRLSSALYSSLHCCATNMFNQVGNYRSNKLTPDCTIVVLRVLFPPYLLPYVPIIVLANMPCDHASDGLTHGLGWLPRLLLELRTCRIYDVFPQISSKFEVFFAQIYPLIECLSNEEGHGNASSLLLM